MRRQKGGSESYKKALNEGDIEVAYSRIMLLGVAGVGKTSLKKGLMRCPWQPDQSKSTLVAELHSVRPVNRGRPVDYRWMGVGEHWEEVTHQDEINEIARLLAAVYKNRSKKDAKGLFDTAMSDVAAALASTNATCTSGKTSVKASSSDGFGDAVDSTLQDAIALIDSIDTSKEVEVQPFLHVWDCGGQPVFLEMLPAFLTSRTMFLLLFDASKDFNSNWESVQYKDGKRIPGEKINMKIIDVVLQWLANIFAHLVRYDAQGALLEYPRVLVIGTRGDLLSAEQKEEKRREFFSYCEGKAYMELLKEFYIVDNTKAKKYGDDGEEPNFKELRSQISDFTTQKLIEKTHVSWVLFRKVIQGLKQNVITLDNAYAIGEACIIPQEEVEKVLTFYHELGVLLFYPNIKGLETKVIVKPKWFVDILSKVLTLEGREEYQTMSMWKILRHHGVLVQPLYVAAWRDSEGVDPEAIMTLLTSFCLAAPVETKLYHKYNSKQYFLPAVLPAYTGDLHAIPSGFQKRASPLHITFSTKFVPPGFFTRFASKVADSSLCKILFDEELNDPEKRVYRNRIRFRYGKPAYDDVILTDLMHMIQVDVLRFIPDPHRAITTLGKVCRDLLIFLNDCCEAVSNVMCSVIYREMRFVCSDEKCKDDQVHYIIHVPEQTQQVDVGCAKSNKYRSLTQEERYWFSAGSNTEDGIIPDNEILKISREIDPSRGTELAAVLNMINVFRAICNNSSQNAQPIMHLLLAWKDVSGQRNDLANALREIGLHRIVEMVCPNDNSESAPPPGNSIETSEPPRPTEKPSEDTATSDCTGTAPGTTGLLLEPATPSQLADLEHELALSGKEIYELSKMIELNKVKELAANLDMLHDLDGILSNEIDKGNPALSLLHRWSSRRTKHDREGLANILRRINLHNAAILVCDEPGECHDTVSTPVSGGATAVPCSRHSSEDEDTCEIISDREILRLSKHIAPNKARHLAAQLNLSKELKSLKSEPEEQAFDFMCKWKEVRGGRRHELYDGLKEIGLPEVAERVQYAPIAADSVNLSLPPSGNNLSECLKSFDDIDLEALTQVLEIADTDGIRNLDRPAKVEKCLEILGNPDQYKNRQEIINCFTQHHLYKAANILTRASEDFDTHSSSCTIL